MLSRGNLALFKPNGDVQWESRTQGTGANRLAFQGDGNLVLYTAKNKPVWWTRTDRLGLNHGVLELFWGTNMGRCMTGQPGALQLSGARAGAKSSYVWTSCALTNMFSNSALASTSFTGSAMASPNGANWLWYQNDGSLSILHGNATTGPPLALLWQSRTSGLPSLLFGFNRARNGPALYNGSFDRPVWSESGIIVSGLPYRWFAMQNDGNFVLYASSDPAHTQNIRAIWDTGTALG